MPQLHYHPGNASMAPHILLEELGLPFERVLVDRANGAAEQTIISLACPIQLDHGPRGATWTGGCIAHDDQLP